MEKVKAAGNEVFNKSSMTVVELNNYIVALRSTVKRAKNQAVQKLVKQIKQYKNRKGTEEQMTANGKRVDRLVAELMLLKKVKADKATKYSLGNTLTIEQAASRGNTEEKVLTRIACSKLMQKKVARWRQEHNDWQALAAFALSKNTGRRFKKTLQSGSSSMLNASVSEENNVSATTLSERSEEHLSNTMEDSVTADSDVVVNNESQQTSSVRPRTVKHESPASHCKQQMVERLPGGGSSTLDTQHDAIVKQVSLEELSDEELFLPPPSEDISESVKAAGGTTGTKIANGFFVVSSDGESSDNETPASETLVRTAHSSSDNDDDDAISTGVLRNSVKSSTMFAKSLSFRQPRNAVKTVGNEMRRKMNGSVGHHRKLSVKAKKDFADNRTRKRFSSNTKSADSSRLKKSSYQNYKVHKNAKGEQSRRNGMLASTASDAAETDRRKKADSAHEKLHPSWEASRQRKEREKNVFVFQGTRKTFSDDD